MNFPAINQAPSFAKNATPEQRIGILERGFEEIRRALNVLRQKQIGKENMKDEFLVTRLVSSTTYAGSGEIENLRLGGAESAGILDTLSRGDHKHAVDPVMIWLRNDPTQLSANTNDWALDVDHSLFYVDASLAVNVTGIAGGVDGRWIFLVNDGAFDITLKHQDALSTASNRIVTGGIAADVVLNPHSVAWMAYDSTIARWRIMGGWGI